MNDEPIEGPDDVDPRSPYEISVANSFDELLERTARDIESIAAEVRSKRNYFAHVSSDGYTYADIAAAVQKAIAWGVANLHTESLTLRAAVADAERIARQQSEGTPAA